MTVIVTAVFNPLEGRRDELIAAIGGAIPAVHAEAGCRLYAIHDASDGTVTMIEKWDSPEHLAAHASGAAIATLGAATEALLAAPATVTTMTPLPFGEPEKGVL